MKKYYKILGLEDGATKADIEKKYKELSKEYAPSNNNNQEFFREEYKKVQEAYGALITSNILSNPGKEPRIKPVISQTSVPNDDMTESNGIPLPSKTVKQENNIFRNALLFFIAAGVWAIFLQNIGFFVQRDDYAQKVIVVNTVDTQVRNSIDVYGSVDVSGSVVVDNIVDVNMESVNGYNTTSYSGGLLGVHDPYD
jgi:preprotein translocase subunit Sec63